ncbi:DUF4179 domain-containing protein [Saccharibacillus sp. CPCC 101409]|uniref:DUF4179 domain-containing protein n=1 Tax=Saccharibacillus sp. CPCC 101409 TaxID=3058041 RepID=UPI0026716843|nr:DUF4179 domain-containing protein [Saccharibacillus sp. CPCC 101409]MDO3411521.1 DUF4179 domain-containing protein [Saccharibacillus sp. CPCC 101409]
MSVYDELNGLKIDLAEYGEEELSEVERQRWERRVRAKVRADGETASPRSKRRAGKRPVSGKSRRSRWLIPAAAALLLTIGATLPAGQEALARLPFVAGLLERFAGQGENVDYSAYKDQIGESAENEYGKLTLNEIIVDTDRLLIGTTLEPAQGKDMGDVVYLNARVTLNGRSDLQLHGGSGGADKQNGRYIVYENIPFSEIPAGEKLRITLKYDSILKPGQDGKLIGLSKPWIFDIETSRAALLAKIDSIEVNRKIDLINGQQIEIEKVISSPISTLVYYRTTKMEDIGSKWHMYGFRLVSESGEEFPMWESFGSMNEMKPSYARYAPVDLRQGHYSLIPEDGTNGKKLGEAVPIVPEL